MIKRKGSYSPERVDNMRAGDGFVTIERLLTPEELYDKGRFYAIMTLENGSSIGYHVHEGEMESFYVVAGEADYIDGDETVRLQPGDSTLTRSGEMHSIRSVGVVPLVLVAQILYK